METWRVGMKDGNLRLFEVPEAPEVPARLPAPRRCKPRPSAAAHAQTPTRSPRDLVSEFHEALSLVVNDLPTLDIALDVLQLRCSLLEEELSELRSACDDQDIVAVADALADSVYVLYGTAITLGIDLDAVLTEVHRSNMTKVGPAGVPRIRADGKVMKGPYYQPPDIAFALGLQGAPSPIPSASHGQQ